jgi:SET family sugar efflux transporter-like MFS transporter
MSHPEWSRDQILVTGLLATSLFLSGLSAAAIAPYRAVVAVKELGFSNGAYAAIITVSSLATAIASVVLGALSDRIGDRRRLVILSAVMGGIAYALIFLAPGRLTYLVAFCAILPFGGALFSQTFAFSRAYYDRNAPERAIMMTSVLRTMFSAAWVVVPPIAGWIASTTSVFNVFAFADAGHLGCTLIFALMLRRPDALLPPVPRPQTKSRAFWRVLPVGRLVGIGGILALRTALLLQLTLLPLAMLTDFHGSYTDVGLTAALAAGLEIPFMLAWGWIATRWRIEHVLIMNALIYAAYLIAMTRVSTPYQVLWLQGPNAVATAALVSLTISYVQDSIKGQVGLSTSLLDVLTVAATLLTAGVFRAFSTDHSYLGGFLAAGGASLIGAGLLALAGRMERHKAE